MARAMASGQEILLQLPAVPDPEVALKSGDYSGEFWLEAGALPTIC